jgi:chemotaxis protein CheC
LDPLTEDQKDALQELANVAMGWAGKSLATLLEAYVQLSVPRVQLLDRAELVPAMEDLVPATEDVTAIRQAFFHSFRGEALALFTDDSWRSLADLMGHDGEVTEAEEQEILLETTNILIGAVLGGLGSQMAAEFHYTPPSFLAMHAPLDTVLAEEELDWEQALLLDVHFTLEERGFRCHLLIMLPEASVGAIARLLQNVLEEL